MLRIHWLALIILLPLTGMAGFEDHFGKGSLRFDYYHTGSSTAESISHGNLKWEPIYGGSKTNLIDTYGYGNYMLRMEDKASGALIYSRGYSTLFNEWKTTAEALVLSRTFQESVLCPYPLQPVILRILMRGHNNQWKSLFSMEVDPLSYTIAHDALPLADTVRIHYSGDPATRVDVVFLAEGYTALEMNKFLADCNRFKSYLFGAQPFDTQTENFNLWAVMVPSQQSGTDIPHQNVWANTVFNSHFNTFGIERYLTVDDYWSIRDYSALAPCDQIIVLVNHSRYGGGGFYNFMTVATVDDKNSNFLLIHEFGHAFAGLADEYSSHAAVQNYYPPGTEPWEPNITTLVDFGSKWKDMLPPGTPIPTPYSSGMNSIVGVFEGAGYAEKGVYRAMPECTMRSIRYNNFCAVCRRAIVRMIDFYST